MIPCAGLATVTDPCEAFQITDLQSAQGVIFGQVTGYDLTARVSTVINGNTYVGVLIDNVFQISGVSDTDQSAANGQPIGITIVDPETGCDTLATVTFVARGTEFTSCSGTGIGIDTITSSNGIISGTSTGLGDGNIVWTTVQGVVYSTLVQNNAFTFNNIPESVYSTFATLGITVSASNGQCVDNDNHIYNGTGQSSGGGGGGGAVATGCLFEATGAQLAWEAENTVVGNNWIVGQVQPGFNGSGYLIYDQPSLSINVNQNDTLTYTFRIVDPGNYRFYFRNTALFDTAPDKNNDLWARHSGGSVPGQTATAGTWHKLFRTIPQPNEPWNWDIFIDPNEGGGTYWANFSAGVHTLTIAGRSGQFYVDAIALLKDGNGLPDGVPKLDCVGSQVNLSPAGYPQAVGRFTPDDLLSLHYDSAPDPDDIHATAAGACVVQAYSLGSRTLVAGGAYGLRVWNNGSTPGGTRWSNYNAGVENVLNTAYGNTWYNVRGATDGQFNFVQQFAEQWKATLDTGADVWVAEGGPSDFTAQVGQYMVNTLGVSAVDLQRVHVVQHSEWNDQNTDPGNLAWVKANLSYTRVDNGNLSQVEGQGGTADFRSNPGTNDVQTWADDNFWNQATTGDCSAVWQQARNAFSNPRVVDFSDTVELLYILNIPQGSGQLLTDIEDFTETYL